MSFLETIEFPQPKVGPALIVGAVSPLWGYFGAAALGGLAYWWMTRWSEAANFEALYAAWNPAKLSETTPLVTPAALAAAAEVAPPLGGEAAPVSPVVAVMAEVPAKAAEPAAEAPKAATTAPTEPATFAEPASSTRARRTAPPAPDA